jgi:hypothetical protein
VGVSSTWDGADAGGEVSQRMVKWLTTKGSFNNKWSLCEFTYVDSVDSDIRELKFICTTSYITNLNKSNIKKQGEMINKKLVGLILLLS